MYGRDQDKDGNKLKSSGASPILVGERVAGCTIQSLEFAKDDQGNEIMTRAELKFLQPNGATFSHSFMDSSEDWAVDKTNREMLHICTKFVPEVEYYAAIGEPTNFTEFINRVRTKLIAKAAGKKFTLKIVYRLNKKKGKYYPSFPTYPSFIEVDGNNPSTLSTNPKYDFYTVPTATETNANGPMTEAVGEGNGGSDLPF